MNIDLASLLSSTPTLAGVLLAMTALLGTAVIALWRAINATENSYIESLKAQQELCERQHRECLDRELVLSSAVMDLIEDKKTEARAKLATLHQMRRA